MNETTEEYLNVGVTCVMCEILHTLHLPKKGLIAWKSGTLIQEAFPELDADTRELLISHTCAPCFDKMFSETETA